MKKIDHFALFDENIANFTNTKKLSNHYEKMQSEDQYGEQLG
jgi:hypothetical protein